MLSARKESGKYTEGVLLSKSMEVLFRAVPPSLYLALAMTESEEKKERYDVMQSQGGQRTRCRHPGRRPHRPLARNRTPRHHLPRTHHGLGAPGMRTLNSLTQNLIESLTLLLQKPGEDALQTLVVCAPVLIEQLQEVLVRAVDRRDFEVQLRAVLEVWLTMYPQSSAAETALFEGLLRSGLVSQA